MFLLCSDTPLNLTAEQELDLHVDIDVGFYVRTAALLEKHSSSWTQAKADV